MGVLCDCSDVTSDCQIEGGAPRRGEAVVVNVHMINTCVVSSVGVAHGRQQEVGGVIDSCQGEVQRLGGVGDQLEGASRVLWLDGTCDGEVGAQEQPEPPPVDLEDPVRQGDVCLRQQICPTQEHDWTNHHTGEQPSTTIRDTHGPGPQESGPD